MRRILLLVCTLSAFLEILSFSFTYDVLKPQFEKDFNESCSKYPFVQKYFERLMNPTGQVITFVFQQPRLRNGGLGDRLAGLVSAAGMAIRFNRALIIRAENDFFRLFRPYLPFEYEEQYKDKITYNRTNLEWAKYNYKNENNDNTELDLWNCINVPGSYGVHCGQIWGNPGQPNILLRGNRAYICRWAHSPNDYVCKQEVNREIGPENDDYMESAGCMLRLAMWPTDLMWQSIDEAMESHRSSLKERGLTRHHEESGKWRKLVSLHFRCGDLGYIHGESYNLACQHSEVISNVTVGSETILTYNIPKHQESGYMMYGTPLDIARCAGLVLANFTTEEMMKWEAVIDSDNDRRKVRRLRENVHPYSWYDNYQQIVSGHRKSRHLDASLSETILRDILTTLEFRTVVHLASDNIGGAQQMNETLNWPNTLLSPSGCHLEMDPTFECLKLTMTYWMVMVLSDIIITPGNDRIPNSGFSRYAAVYGLKGNSLRDPKQCTNILSRRDLSNIQHGNWNCL